MGHDGYLKAWFKCNCVSRLNSSFFFYIYPVGVYSDPADMQGSQIEQPAGNSGSSTSANPQVNQTNPTAPRINNEDPRTTAPKTNPQKYSSVAASKSYPKKEQALIIEVKEGISLNLKDYAIAISNLTGKENLRFISKVSQNRICITLSSKQWVDKITENKTIEIKGNRLNIRPLIIQSKRIVFSNVCPWIPDSVLVDILKKAGIRLESGIMFLRAGLDEPGLNHTNSHRRQAYINPDDISKIPKDNKVQINWDGTTYWIYISTELITCYLCKEDGHIARQCPNVDPSTNTKDDDSSNQQKSNGEAVVAEDVKESTLEAEAERMTQQTTPSTTTEVNNGGALNGDEVNSPSNKDVLEILGGTNSQVLVDGGDESSLPTSVMDFDQTGLKRQRDSTPSRSSNASTSTQGNPAKEQRPTRKLNKNKKKKIKDNLEQEATSSSTTREGLKPLEAAFLANHYCLTLEKFHDLLEEMFGNPNIIEVARKYTDNIPGLSLMMSELLPQLTDRKLKSTFNRVNKKLRNSIMESNDEKEVDSTVECSSSGSEEDTTEGYYSPISDLANAGS